MIILIMIIVIWKSIVMKIKITINIAVELINKI